jgi:hypothetical protein
MFLLSIPGLHNAATWYMVGVIWLIQLVHYPMLEFLDRATFIRSHNFHTTGMGFVVMPAMLIELVLASSIFWKRGSVAAGVGFALLMVIWAMTFFVMVPLHNRLASEGFQPQVHRALVQWNWVRTVAWTARGIIASFFL